MAALHDVRSPLLRFASGAIEKDTDLRAATLKQELEVLAGKSPSPGVYQRIRGYFSLTSPIAFEQIERLESEQKFFRTATIATAIIALVVNAWWLWVVAAFLLTRYINRRRKTIERAYMLFGLRRVIPVTAMPAT